MNFKFSVNQHAVCVEHKLSVDGQFPNNQRFPLLHYKGVFKLPDFLPALFIKQLFNKHNWSNAWTSGIFTYQHYHSTTHEVLGFYQGQTTLLLGGEKGIEVVVKKGDVVIIPAGVAHKNLGAEKDALCVGAYPGGRAYDMNYGRKEERPQTDHNISIVGKPTTDPVFGKAKGIPDLW